MKLKKIEQVFQNRRPSVMGIRHEYAVLLPLVELDGQLNLLYEVRAETLRRQPGEICFPGGKLERGETPEEGALRETEEELGIPASAVRLLGPLDLMHHQGVSLMHPFLGVISRESYEQIRINDAEVKEVFPVPVDYLVKHPPFVYAYKMIPDVGSDFPYEKIQFKAGYSWKPGRAEVPIYEYEGHVIWGITGRMTRSFLQTMGEKQ